DTLTRMQILSNYYAYDDGTAEAGYGLTPAGAQLAYRFTLNEPDTLRAVKMFFNKTWHNGNEQYFRLTVWDDNNGKPGNIIYTSKPILPEFTESLNEFTTYYINDQYVAFTKKNTTFYVGWQQSTDETLNIGYDFSNNNSENIFYNTSGQWLNSDYTGSLMIRPVFGAKLVDYDIDDITTKKSVIKICPNPANGNNIKILLPDNEINKEEMQTTIYGITGRVIYKGKYKQQISIKHLVKGIYIVVLSNTATGSRYSNKLIVTNTY
ncbi:MAG: T9SS type A sorting domain-containing protein, partial [Bacteroidota bacterium]|nr:T9SS type A sorting domain-containing protein [Bacteroidota bacterium]